MSNKKLFKSNLEQYAKYDKETANLIEACDAKELFFYPTHIGEKSLAYEKNGKLYSYHPLEGAEAEASKWEEIFLSNPSRVFYIFGIGLGYYYTDRMKQWLFHNPRSRLIFLENDLRVLKRFFETEKAKEILNTPQVFVHYIGSKDSKDIDTDKIYDIVYGFAANKGRISCLAHYYETDKDTFDRVRMHLYYAYKCCRVGLQEDFFGHMSIADNMIYNILRVQDSYNAECFYHHFKGLPAIVCGAGPSIKEELPLLKKHSNKAIILGAGTGINVLTNSGITPHIAAVLDPTLSQASRLKMSFAFEIPYVYRARLSKIASKYIQGPIFFVKQLVGMPLLSWFEKEISIHQDTIPGHGISSTNFATEIAYALGCDPIIILGNDMAYTEEKRYPDLVNLHAAERSEERKEVHTMQSDLLEYISNTGEKVVTKYDWTVESNATSEFQKNHQDVRVINSSKGGLIIFDVPYVPFEEVCETYLHQSYPIDDWLYSFYEDGVMKDLNQETTLKACDSAYKSFEVCIDQFKKLDRFIQKEKDSKRSWEEIKGDFNDLQEQVFSKLQDEPAFTQVSLNAPPVIDSFLFFGYKLLKCHKEIFSDEEIKSLRINMKGTEYCVYTYLLKNYLFMIEKEIELAKKEKCFFKEKKERKEAHRKKVDPEKRYEFEKMKLVMIDKDFNLNINKDFNPPLVTPSSPRKNNVQVAKYVSGKPHGECLIFDEENNLKGQFYYNHGKMHGPCRFYSKNTDLISETWYYNDKKVGVAKRFYPSQKVYAELGYKDDEYHGKQNYYFESANIKSCIPYELGLLHGRVRLYYRNGVMKRQMYFTQGKLDGVDEAWNNDGSPIFKAEYKMSKPVGISYEWHENGTLMRKVIHNETEDLVDIYEWDESGNLIKELSRISKKDAKEYADVSLEKEIHDFMNEMQILKNLQGPDRKMRFY